MTPLLRRRTGLALIGLTAALAFAPAVDGSPTAAGGAWTREAQQLRKRPADLAVKRDVLQALAKAPSIDYRAVKVLVSRGIVTLRGTVATIRDRARAEKIAAAVPGVRLVINQLEIAGPTIRKSAY